jgi:hypothetical protein
MALGRRYQAIRGAREGRFVVVGERRSGGRRGARAGAGRAAFERCERGAEVLANHAGDREAAADRDRGMAACADGADDTVGGRGLELAGVAAGSEERAGEIGERGRPGEQVPGGVEHHARADISGQFVHVLERQRGRQGRRHRRRAEYGPVPLNRIAWLTTVAICLVISVILLFSGYLGYAGVLLAIALSAAINLR